MELSRRHALVLMMGGTALWSADLIWEFSGGTGIFRGIKRLATSPTVAPLTDVRYDLSSEVKTEPRPFDMPDIERIIKGFDSQETASIDQVADQVAYGELVEGFMFRDDNKVETHSRVGQFLLLPGSSDSLHYFITAYHTLKGLPESLTASLYVGKEDQVIHYGSLLAYSKQADLALGWCYGGPLDLKHIALSDRSSEKVDIVTSSSPKNNLKTAIGVVKDSNQSYLSIDADIGHGYSGSPVVAKGKVEGLIVLKNISTDQGIAIKSSYIKELLEFYANSYKN